MCDSILAGGRRCPGHHGRTPAQERAHLRASYAARKAITVTDPVRDDEIPATTRVLPRGYSPDLPDGLPPAAWHTQALRDLRRELVGDDAEPGASAKFYAALSEQRAAAQAAGMSSDHLWSPAIWGTLNAEAERRGGGAVRWFAGPGQWAGQGREVLPGAEPYSVNVPVVGEDGETTWKVLPVWDWTQTGRVDGMADPAWKADVPGGSEELFDRLVASSPLPVVRSEDGTTGKSAGHTDGDSIVINMRRPVGNRIQTLAHELSHVWLRHPQRITAGQADEAHTEQEAETAAYLIVSALDLGDATDAQARVNTATYLRDWTRKGDVLVTDHQERWRMLQDRIEPASEVAVTILTHLLTVGQGRRLPWDEESPSAA